jgi:hypothetical protein
MAGKIIGRATIRADGKSFSTENGATLNPGGFAREPVNSDQGYAGYAETHVNAEVSCNVICDDETNVTTLNAITEATLTFECGNGVAYVVRRASVAEPAQLDTSNNRATVAYFVFKVLWTLVYVAFLIFVAYWLLRILWSMAALIAEVIFF